MMRNGKFNTNFWFLVLATLLGFVYGNIQAEEFNSSLKTHTQDSSQNSNPKPLNDSLQSKPLKGLSGLTHIEIGAGMMLLGLGLTPMPFGNPFPSILGGTGYGIGKGPRMAKTD